MYPRILMKQYSSSPRKEKVDTRDKRRERLQGIALGTSSAPRLAECCSLGPLRVLRGLRDRDYQRSSSDF